MTKKKEDHKGAVARKVKKLNVSHKYDTIKELISYETRQELDAELFNDDDSLNLRKTLLYKKLVGIEVVDLSELNELQRKMPLKYSEIIKLVEDIVSLSLKEHESIRILNISGLGLNSDRLFEAIGDSQIHTLHMQDIDLRRCTNFHEHLARAESLENLYMSGCKLPVPRVEVFSKLVTAPSLKRIDKSKAQWFDPSRRSYELDEGDVDDTYIRSDVQTSNKILLKHALQYHAPQYVITDTLCIVAGYLGVGGSVKPIEVVGEGDDPSYLS